jgi:hypothetical protein
MATAGGAVHPDGHKAAAKAPSNACIINNLKQELVDKQQLCNRLKQENSSLRTREVMLSQTA